MDFEAIKKAAQAYGPDMTRFLRDMIAIPSESCEEREVVACIKAEMEKTLLSPRPQYIAAMVQAGLLDHLHPMPKGPELDTLEELAGLPPTKEARWRGFCALTGFPITVLPVERTLRRAVEYPELAVIPTLALSGRDLMALGFKGPAISAAQKRLAEVRKVFPDAFVVCCRGTQIVK